MVRLFLFKKTTNDITMLANFFINESKDLPNLGKKYKDAVEEKFRMKIFAENKLKILAHNHLFKRGLVTYNLEMNIFGDLVTS